MLLFACKPAGGKVETQISGKVMYKGAPLGGGNIVFHFANGGSAPAGINPDGTYTVQNVPVGPTKVTVETESIKGAGTQPSLPPGAPKEMKEKLEHEKGKLPTSAAGYVAIPKKYADVNTTTLSYEVKSGKQEHDFDLSD